MCRGKADEDDAARRLRRGVYQPTEVAIFGDEYPGVFSSELDYPLVRRARCLLDNCENVEPGRPKLADD